MASGDLVQQAPDVNATANNTSATVTGTLPSAPTVGNTLFITAVSSGTIATPTGWTLDTGASVVDNAAMYVFRRTVQLSDPTSFNVGPAASNRGISLALIEIEGVCVVDSHAATFVYNATNTQARTTGACTTVHANTFLIGAISEETTNPSTFSAYASPFVERSNLLGTGGTNPYGCHSFTAVESLQGTYTATATSTRTLSRYMGVLVAYSFGTLTGVTVSVAETEAVAVAVAMGQTYALAVPVAKTETVAVTADQGKNIEVDVTETETVAVSTGNVIVTVEVDISNVPAMTGGGNLLAPIAVNVGETETATVAVAAKTPITVSVAETEAVAVSSGTNVSTVTVSVSVAPALPLYFGAAFNFHNDTTSRIKIAGQIGANAIRLVDWLLSTKNVTHTYNDTTAWGIVDSALAQAKAAGLRVVLDFSTYRNFLAAPAPNGAATNPYTADWTTFVNFVAARTSPNGGTYATDPTIAYIAIAGEPWPAAGNAANANVDTFDVTSLVTFYSTVGALIRAAFPNTPISCGGLLHYAADNAGVIDWHAIFALSVIDYPAIHVYSGVDFGNAVGTGDESVVPTIASYCTANLHKPWILEEFGFDQNLGDAVRAPKIAAVMALAATYAASGVGFWNDGTELWSGTPTLNAAGAWSSSTPYNVLDSVTSGGGTWYALVANTNVTPNDTNSQTWGKVKSGTDDINTFTPLSFAAIQDATRPVYPVVHLSERNVLHLTVGATATETVSITATVTALVTFTYTTPVTADVSPTAMDVPPSWNNLMRHYSARQRGIAVWMLTDGTATEAQPFPTVEDTGGNRSGVYPPDTATNYRITYRRVFLGGHVYTDVTTVEAQALLAAGLATLNDNLTPNH